LPGCPAVRADVLRRVLVETKPDIIAEIAGIFRVGAGAWTTQAKIRSVGTVCLF